jgi:hypothetical protein
VITLRKRSLQELANQVEEELAVLVSDQVFESLSFFEYRNCQHYFNKKTSRTALVVTVLFFSLC